MTDGYTRGKEKGLHYEGAGTASMQHVIVTPEDTIEEGGPASSKNAPWKSGSIRKSLPKIA